MAKKKEHEKIDLSAQALLDALTSGALLSEPGSGKIAYANPIFGELAGLKKTALPKEQKMVSQWLQLPGEVVCTLCNGKEGEIADHVSPLHGALLRSEFAAGEKPGLPVMIKHSILPGGNILTLIDADPNAETGISRAHNDFVSVVSHEFRTPLTSIKGFADTMLRYGSQLPEEQQRKFVTIIKDQADRLTRLVENLLTVTKLEGRVDFSFRAVSIEKILEKVIQTVQSKGSQHRQYENRRILLTLAPNLPGVWADADKLEQVLLNLVDNAVKYSYPDTAVTVTVALKEDDAELLVITIRDQGVGIPAEHLSKIFSRFSRIDNPLTREVEGTGLGLYITKSLTLAMGGEIIVESEAGQGTVFRVMFPVATAERQAKYRKKLLSDNPLQQESTSTGTLKDKIDGGLS